MSIRKRHLLKRDIVNAYEICSGSSRMAAKKLNVSFNTFKRWAKLYECYNPLPVGCPKGRKVNRKNPYSKSKYDVDQLINKVTRPKNYSLQLFLKRLYYEKKKREKCEACSYSQKSAITNKMPLLLKFLDHDNTNWNLDNMRLLCYNCSYVYFPDTFTVCHRKPETKIKYKGLKKKLLDENQRTSQNERNLDSGS